jgi:hypothetical protein
LFPVAFPAALAKQMREAAQNALFSAIAARKNEGCEENTNDGIERLHNKDIRII